MRAIPSNIDIRCTWNAFMRQTRQAWWRGGSLLTSSFRICCLTCTSGAHAGANELRCLAPTPPEVGPQPGPDLPYQASQTVCCTLLIRHCSLSLGPLAEAECVPAEILQMGSLWQNCSLATSLPTSSCTATAMCTAWSARRTTGTCWTSSSRQEALRHAPQTHGVLHMSASLPICALHGSIQPQVDTAAICIA